MCGQERDKVTTVSPFYRLNFSFNFAPRIYCHMNGASTEEKVGGESLSEIAARLSNLFGTESIGYKGSISSILSTGRSKKEKFHTKRERFDYAIFLAFLFCLPCSLAAMSY